MTPYNLALFIHIVGAIGTFIGVSVWLFAALALRRAQQVAQVRALAGLTAASGNIAVGGVLLVAAAGLYMALTAWSLQVPWIVVATISFALLAPFGVFVLDPRIRAIAKAASAAPDGPLPPSLAKRTHDPILGGGLFVYIGVLLGIVFLMTNKPPLDVSVLAMVVATALGLAAALPLWWAARSSMRKWPEKPQEL